MSEKTKISPSFDDEELARIQAAAKSEGRNQTNFVYVAAIERAKRVQK